MLPRKAVCLCLSFSQPNPFKNINQLKCTAFFELKKTALFDKTNENVCIVH